MLLVLSYGLNLPGIVSCFKMLETNWTIISIPLPCPAGAEKQQDRKEFCYFSSSFPLHFSAPLRENVVLYLKSALFKTGSGLSFLKTDSRINDHITDIG